MLLRIQLCFHMTTLSLTAETCRILVNGNTAMRGESGGGGLVSMNIGLFGSSPMTFRSSTPSTERETPLTTPSGSTRAIRDALGHSWPNNGVCIFR